MWPTYFPLWKQQLKQNKMMLLYLLARAKEHQVTPIKFIILSGLRS